MRAVILAAGRGSRLGQRTEDKPKLFLQVNGRTVYEHQRAVIDEYCDDVSVVLGHGFDGADDEEIERSLRIGGEPDVRGLYLENWPEVENAASLERALGEFAETEREDHVLVVCGDVLFSEDALVGMLTRFDREYRREGYNAVGCVRGLQEGMTAVRYDDEGVITDYGSIEGHQEIGLFVLHRKNLSAARETLAENPTEWFPVVFTETPSKRVVVPAEKRWEINTPEHLARADERVSRWH